MNEQQNRQLTQVGPNTPMGDLLRRYWMPIAGVSESELCDPDQADHRVTQKSAHGV